MKLDVLAVGAHPDDVELGCGGTVATLTARGLRVGLLHLTRGEAGTRGTVEERRREAETAAQALGAASLDVLDCGDARFRSTEAEEAALIAVLRKYRPELVLGPTPHDRHPDHRRAHELVEAACFYAGLRGRPGGEPYRPAACFAYMQHDPFAPSFIVDVTAAWPAKMAALDAYASQIHHPGAEPRAEPMTLVASEDFRLAVEGRARHFGAIVGVTFGEPFWSRLPLAVRDPFSILPAGIR